MSSKSIAILATGLVKDYGQVRAVDHLDLKVRRGEVYGFLGRNGAGKTTAMRTILGLVRPTSGRVEVFGSPADPAKPGWLSRVGCLIENATGYPHLTVRENLQLHCRLTGTPAARVPEAIDRLDLTDFANRRFNRLSQGNRQRLAIARALLPSPELLILDEPGNGLDPAGLVWLRELVGELVAQGTSVLISSHLLAEIAHLADRIGIIHNGRLVEELDRAAMVSAARDFAARTLTPTEREEAVLAVELERYFLARTGTDAAG